MKFKHREESVAITMFMWFIGVQVSSVAAAPSTFRKDTSTTLGEIPFSAGILGEQFDCPMLKVCGMQEEERLCCLTSDELSLTCDQSTISPVWVRREA